MLFFSFCFLFCFCFGHLLNRFCRHLTHTHRHRHRYTRKRTLEQFSTFKVRLGVLAPYFLATNVHSHTLHTTHTHTDTLQRVHWYLWKFLKIRRILLVFTFLFIAHLPVGSWKHPLCFITPSLALGFSAFFATPIRQYCAQVTKKKKDW